MLKVSGAPARSASLVLLVAALLTQLTACGDSGSSSSDDSTPQRHRLRASLSEASSTPEASSPPPATSTPQAPLIRPIALRYTYTTVVYAVADPIIPNIPSVRGGEVDTYSIEPSLPPGLTIDSQTGVISGMPATTSATTIYAVTAANVRGSTIGRVQIEVADSVLAPESLRYPLESAIYPVGQEIPPNVPIATGGEITQFTVGPAPAVRPLTGPSDRYHQWNADGRPDGYAVHRNGDQFCR